MRTDLVNRLADEAIHYEEQYNDSEQNPEMGHRRSDGRAPKLLTIRLTAEQYDQVAKAAAEADLPVSTFARNALMDAIAPRSNPAVIAQVEDALRQLLRPELLRA